ncbi:hypothetical protein M8818_002390 [Zalaria obscura]|uniref:Uncharacterized protein n=1 Tax=Zalaria obscura TaxID=2024903 RepID=A0ACC3SHN3_9PEZI
MATSLTTASLGSNYPTAFREFRKVFKEKTGVEWDQRLVAFDKVVGTHTASAVSAAAGSGGRGDTGGMSKGKKRKTNLEEESLERERLEKERQERAWKEMKFIYTPPVGNAPKGVLPDGVHVPQTLQSTEDGDSHSGARQGRGVSEGLAGGTNGFVGGMSPHVGEQGFAMSGGLGFAVEGQAQEGAMQWGQSLPAIGYDTAAGQGSRSLGLNAVLGSEQFGTDGQAVGGAASNVQESFGIPVPGFESQGYFQDMDGQALQPPLLNLDNLERLEGDLDPELAEMFPEFDGKVSEEFMAGLAEHAG